MAEAAGRLILTIQQAMARTAVSRRTIYNWMAEGRVAYVRTAGGCVRIFEDTLFRQEEPVTVKPRTVPTHKAGW